MTHKKISSKELKKKIAQLICVEVRFPRLVNSKERTEKLKNSLKKYQWGSVIVFEAEAQRVKALLSDLQKISEIPLLVCSDLERGTGQHFNGATLFPSNMALGAANDPQLAYLTGKVTAQEAMEIGVNVIFAPTTDVNNNPDNPIINVRSYGEDPVLVAGMATAFIKACNEQGVITTAKHFPGHGDTATDSHVDLPVIDKPVRELEKTELYPFKEIIKNGATGIMSAHISVPALDKSLTPATMSKPIITDLLRKKLNFNGLIFTDALIMAGAKDATKEPDVVRALIAGCDILLMPPHPVKALNQILKAVQDGKLHPEVIETAYNRVVEYKRKFPVKTDLKPFDKTEGEKVAREIARKAVTKIKGDIKLPLKIGKNKALHLVIDQDNDKNIWKDYAQKLAEKKVRTVCVNAKVTSEQLEKLKGKIEAADTLIVSFFSQIKAWKKNIYPTPEVFDWLKTNLKNKEVITIAFSNPYLLRKLPVLKNYYCTFSDSPESQEAVTDLLFNVFELHGKSPVKI